MKSQLGMLTCRNVYRIHKTVYDLKTEAKDAGGIASREEQARVDLSIEENQQNSERSLASVS